MKKKSTSVSTIKIIKQDSDNDSHSDRESNIFPTDSSYVESDLLDVPKPRRFTSFAKTDYKRPTKGTKQDNFTKDDIREHLGGYKTLDDKKYLLTLKPFKVIVKYYNTKTQKFRSGGLLVKVDPELKYIMLVNTRYRLTWSVQLEDNIIFVPDPKIAQEKKRLIQEEIDKKEQEEKTKGKLYDLYLKGKLTLLK
jgi:hypothetical protein